MRDVDGNEYVDYVLAYGPLILGHAPHVVVEAIKEQAVKGTIFGVGYEEEYLLAEELTEIIPCCDQVRFSNSGSEALHFTMRLARAYTGRRRIIKFEGHYHGWLDDQFVNVKPDTQSHLSPNIEIRLETAGQPPDAAENLVILPWNDLNAVEKVLISRAGEIAAIILEPVMFYNGGILPEKGYLEGLRRLTEEHGVLLIFDEVVTGFRLALGGAQEYFGVVPDLCVFAKGFAAGLPLAGLGGKRRIMELVADNTVPQMGTYNGNPLAVAGALAAIREVKRNGGAAIKRMVERGKTLSAGLRSLFDDIGAPFSINGCESVFSLISPGITPRSCRDVSAVDHETIGRFHRAMLEHGVLFMGRGIFMLSAAHTEEDIDLTLAAAKSALADLGFK